MRAHVVKRGRRLESSAGYKDAVRACNHACERRWRLAARMWLASHHHRLDTASGQAPSNQTKDIDKFIHDGRSYGDRPDGEVGRFSTQAWKR